MTWDVKLPRHQSGYTLLEVLVAFFVLSIGLLGLATLQGVALQGNSKSFNRSIAMVQAYDMADRMRANLPGVIAGAYDSLPVAGTVDTACLATGCNPTQLASIDGNQWTAEIARALPNGEGVVDLLPIATTGAAPIFRIDVGWLEPRSSLQAKFEEDEQEFVKGCETLSDDTGLTCFSLEFSP